MKRIILIPIQGPSYETSILSTRVKNILALVRHGSLVYFVRASASWVKRNHPGIRKGILIYREESLFVLSGF